jgi:broad specificity phosphatase PhoE
MAKLLEANRLAVFTRHAITPANKAKYEGSADSRVQGLSPDMPIDPEDGPVQAHAFGIAFGKFVLQHGLRVVAVHASDTVRTIATRDLALTHLGGFTVADPTDELWEHRKGSLEGMLRDEAYPKEVRQQAADNWDFRHGHDTPASKAETPREAGERWLRWFTQETTQPDFQPRTSAKLPIPTLLVFGHNLVTACGITLLNHDGESPLPPVSDRTFKVDNATGLLLADYNGQWSVLSERLIPIPAEVEAARAYIDAPGGSVGA